MSRAFVSEEESEFQDDDLPALKIPLPPGAKNYMTPLGAEKLHSELNRLVRKERPRLAARLARLVSGSEGADRETMSRLRRRLRRNDRRIEYLNAMMARLEVVDPKEQNRERVAFGAVVHVEENRLDLREYKIVGVDESSPADGLISWISPVARALIGARVGENVQLQLPGGETELKILRVRYT